MYEVVLAPSRDLNADLDQHEEAFFQRGWRREVTPAGFETQGHSCDELLVRARGDLGYVRRTKKVCTGISSWISGFWKTFGGTL